MKPIFDNSSLIDWLGRQDPKAEYDYVDGAVCMVARYLQFRGIKGAGCDSDFAYIPGAIGPLDLPPAWDEIAKERPWTFGAAICRARARLTTIKHKTIDEVAA